jgi:hypothetical protein
MNGHDIKKENRKYEEVIERANAAKIPYPTRMFIVPVNFRKSGTSMLGRAQNYMSRGYIVIDKKFDKLVMQMRIARIKENGNQDKDSVNSTMDSFDAFRLCLFNIGLRENKT